jgi:hypothetical protein
MRAACLRENALGSVLSFAGGEFFENAASDALQLAETSQVVLEFGVHELRILGTELDAQDHVAELDGVGKQRVFLEFFESGFGVIVIHKSPGRECALACEGTPRQVIVLAHGARRRVEGLLLSGGSGAGGEKLVAIDLGGYADAAVGAGIDTHDLAVAANIHFSGRRNFLREGKDEVDLAAHFELGFGKKIQAAIADVSSTGAEFPTLRFMREDAHRQAHQKAPRFAAISSIRHQDLSGTNRFDANTRFCKLQS